MVTLNSFLYLKTLKYFTIIMLNFADYSSFHLFVFYYFLQLIFRNFYCGHILLWCNIQHFALLTLPPITIKIKCLYVYLFCCKNNNGHKNELSNYLNLIISQFMLDIFCTSTPFWFYDNVNSYSYQDFIGNIIDRMYFQIFK